MQEPRGVPRGEGRRLTTAKAADHPREAVEALVHGELTTTTPWAFLPKPFSSEQLLAAVHWLLPADPTTT